MMPTVHHIRTKVPMPRILGQICAPATHVRVDARAHGKSSFARRSALSRRCSGAFSARSSWDRRLQVLRMVSMASVMLASFHLRAQAQGKELDVEHPTFYRTIRVDGHSIFFREAGPKDAPTILLLHGLPSSSRMFEPLFARLSDRYHLVAPDYPGFGHSDWPDPKQFDYTFDHIASVIDDFTQAMGLSHYTPYVQDYGGPVGFRMALAHPKRVEALIVQNAVAHNEGLGAIWATRRAFWADRPAHEEALRENLLSFAATKSRH